MRAPHTLGTTPLITGDRDAAARGTAHAAPVHPACLAHSQRRAAYAHSSSNKRWARALAPVLGARLAPEEDPQAARRVPGAAHPNGSVVHVVGVRAFEAAGPAIVRQVIRAATPDSVLLQLCDERVPPVWELIERGTQARADGSLRDPLPTNPFDWNTASSDARLRSFQWWFGGGLDLEGLAALNGTCLGGAGVRRARGRAAPGLDAFD